MFFDVLGAKNQYQSGSKNTSELEHNGGVGFSARPGSRKLRVCIASVKQISCMCVVAKFF